MKLGQAMYEQQQARAHPEGGEPTRRRRRQPADEDVVDAEFSEVDEESRG